MGNSKKAAIYKREPATRGQELPYEQKFANLIKLLVTARKEDIENIIIAWPWVIGDTYAEMVESLNRISDAGLCLHIADSDRPGQIYVSPVSRN